MIRNRTLMRTPRANRLRADEVRIHLDAMEHALRESKVAVEAAKAGAAEHAARALAEVNAQLAELEPVVIDLDLDLGEHQFIEPLDDVLLETIVAGEHAAIDSLDASDADELAREAIRQANETLRTLGEIEVSELSSI